MTNRFLAEPKFRAGKPDVLALQFRSGVPASRAHHIINQLLVNHDLAVNKLQVLHVEPERESSGTEPALGATYFVTCGPERPGRTVRDHERGDFFNNDVERVEAYLKDVHLQLGSLSLTGRTVNAFLLDLIAARHISITETLWTSSGPMSTLLLHMAADPLVAFQLIEDLQPGGRVLAQIDRPSWGVRVLTRAAIDPPTPIALKANRTMTITAQGSYPGVLADCIKQLPDSVRARVINANDLIAMHDEVEHDPFRVILALSARDEDDLRNTERRLAAWARDRGLIVEFQS